MLSLQVNATHPDTFRPDTISLPQPHYEYMMNSMSLPINALETTACVGPLFWWDLKETGGKKRLGESRGMLVECEAWGLIILRNNFQEGRRQETWYHSRLGAFPQP